MKNSMAKTCRRSRLPALALVILGLTAAAFPAGAQTSPAATAVPSGQFDTSDFPQWGKDLRRGEIIAFGSFPFTMFTATFFMDTWRCYNNGWDTKYAPWPFKSAGAVDMTNREHEIVMTAAALTSLGLAFADFVIVHIKQRKAEQRALQMPEGSPIITKRPWPGDAPDSPEIPDPPESPESPESPGETPPGARGNSDLPGLVEP
jgi:hypothetical protein